MNLLSLIQQASAEMGLTQPLSVIGNTTTDVVQHLALLNAAGMELVRDHPWQILDKEYTFTTQSSSLTATTVLGSAVVTGISSTVGLDATYMVQGVGINADTSIASVDSSTQVTLNRVATASGTNPLIFGKTKYALPTDYDREIPATDYDKSRRWQMLGPLTPQQWQNIKSSWVASAPIVRYRLLGGLFQIWPLVSTSDLLGFEYMSNAWVTPLSGGTSKTLFTLDTDSSVFSDRLMILALKRKYFEIKGFDVQFFERDYAIELNRAKNASNGATTLSMAPRMSSTLMGVANLPDSGYGAQT